MGQTLKGTSVCDDFVLGGWSGLVELRKKNYLESGALKDEEFSGPGIFATRALSIATTLDPPSL